MSHCVDQNVAHNANLHPSSSYAGEKMQTATAHWSLFSTSGCLHQNRGSVCVSVCVHTHTSELSFSISCYIRLFCSYKSVQRRKMVEGALFIWAFLPDACRSRYLWGIGKAQRNMFLILQERSTWAYWFQTYNTAPTPSLRQDFLKTFSHLYNAGTVATTHSPSVKRSSLVWSFWLIFNSIL